MWFRPTGYDCKYILPRDAEPPEGAHLVSKERSLVWQIESEWRDFVQLASGEWLKDLKGSLRVEEGTFLEMEKGRPIAGTLAYYGAHGYQVRLRVSEREFDRLLELARAQKIPDVMIKPPMRVEGLEAGITDGKKWDVTKSPWIEVLWWDFFLPLSAASDDADDKKAPPMTLANVVDVVNERGRALLGFGWFALVAGSILLWLLRR
jgi:hypothetical protein